MSKIQVNVEDLKNFADIIGDIENQCDDALRHLNWDFSSFLADLPGVSPKWVKEVEEIYRSVIKKYQAKLDHAQQVVKRTEAAMRQAEKNIGDKAGEFGLEMLGYNDVQRVFGEYDPITGEKVSGADRLLATGMLALSLYPPGKAVGVTGKLAIKGVNAGTKTGTKFGLSSFAKSLPSFISLKNVVSTGKVLEVFKGVYKQVVEAPLAATKLWMDRTVRQIADFRMPVFGLQPATAMGALPSKTVGDTFGEAKDAFVKMVKEDGDNLSNGKGNYVSEPKEVVTKGAGNGEKDNYFIGTLKGEEIHLKGVKVEEIIYTKRHPEETAKLRREFNNSVKKNFLKEFANDPVRVEYLIKAGLGEGDIARMKDGLNPKGWQVHHNLPLDDGGTNELSNLVLLKNDPYHKAVTNEQNSLTRGLVPKQSKQINWPMFEDEVYPLKPFKRRDE